MFSPGKSEPPSTILNKYLTKKSILSSGRRSSVWTNAPFTATIPFISTPISFLKSSIVNIGASIDGFLGFVLISKIGCLRTSIPFKLVPSKSSSYTNIVSIVPPSWFSSYINKSSGMSIYSI